MAVFLPSFDVDNTTLGAFIKYWDLNSDIDQSVVDHELSATAVGELLYSIKQHKHVRQHVREVLKATCQTIGLDYMEQQIQ